VRPNPHSDSAASVALGIILLLAITVILAILVLLLCQMPAINLEKDQSIPAIFKITKIRHEDENGKNKLDSYMVVMNTATSDFKSESLSAKTYRNGILLDCDISTLNGGDFIAHSHHYNVQYMSGAKGDTWYANAKIAIDYEDRTFQPGDLVTFEVYDKTVKKVISSHTVKA
jgi:hypothetical protein